MKILIGIVLGFCLTMLLFTLLAAIESYIKGPPFDVNKVDMVNIYGYRSDGKGKKEISDDQPVYRMVGEESRSFFKDIKSNFILVKISYPQLTYSIEIKAEDTYYSGKIYPGLGTIEIGDYSGKLTGKSKEIANSLYTEYRNKNGTRLTLDLIQSYVNGLESKNNINNLIENEYKESELKLNEKLFLLLKNNYNLNEEKIEKYYKRDDWGTPFNVDYTTNLTGLSESLSNSLSEYPIVVWSSGPNGIDERCLGDDIPWPGSRKY